MKKVCLLITGMLLLTLYSIAQDKMDCCQLNDCCQSLLTKSVVTKGYYSIGDNAKKLNKNTGGTACCNNEKSPVVNHQPIATKGYYAIAPRQDSNPQRQSGFVQAAEPLKIAKGFYAVGNNQQKLHKGTIYINGCCNCNCR